MLDVKPNFRLQSIRLAAPCWSWLVLLLHRTVSLLWRWRCSRATTRWCPSCWKTTPKERSACPRCTSPRGKTTPRPPHSSSRTTTTLTWSQRYTTETTSWPAVGEERVLFVSVLFNIQPSLFLTTWYRTTILGVTLGIFCHWICVYELALCHRCVSFSWRIQETKQDTMSPPILIFLLGYFSYLMVAAS